MKALRILVACEHSGHVREAFRARGHDAWSCDLLPASDGSPFHHRGDVLEILRADDWQRLITHPPCTYLTNSAAWAFYEPNFAKYPGVGYHQKLKPGTLTGAARCAARAEAVAFALALWNSGIPQICIENPIGHLSQHLGKAQVLQPYQFGDDASKGTSLWRRGLPALVIDPAAAFPPRYVCQDCGFTWRNGWAGDACACGSISVRPRWSNQTDSGQNRLSPSEDRAHVRAITYHGIANAMADQWR